MSYSILKEGRCLRKTKIMKNYLKVALSLVAITMVGLSVNASNKDELSTNSEVSLVYFGKVHIKYDGGTLCWLPGKACKVDILIEWDVQAPPKEVIDKMKVPVGYKVMSLETQSFEKGDFKLPADRVFTAKEVSDGKEIFVPQQIAFYSKSMDSFYVYAKR